MKHLREYLFFVGLGLLSLGFLMSRGYFHAAPPGLPLAPSPTPQSSLPPEIEKHIPRCDPPCPEAQDMIRAGWRLAIASTKATPSPSPSPTVTP